MRTEDFTVVPVSGIFNVKAPPSISIPPFIVYVVLFCRCRRRMSGKPRLRLRDGLLEIHVR